MNENPTTTAAAETAHTTGSGKNVFTYRETAPRQIEREAFYLLDTIRETAEKMRDYPQDASREDLLIEIGGWAEKILTLSGIALDGLFQLTT